MEIFFTKFSMNMTIHTGEKPFIVIVNPEVINSKRRQERNLLQLYSLSNNMGILDDHETDCTRFQVMIGGRTDVVSPW